MTLFEFAESIGTTIETEDDNKGPGVWLDGVSEYCKGMTFPIIGRGKTMIDAKMNYVERMAGNKIEFNGAVYPVPVNLTVV